MFYIIKAETPFLLSIANIDRLGIIFNNLINYIIKPSPSNNIATSTIAFPVI